MSATPQNQESLLTAQHVGNASALNPHTNPWRPATASPQGLGEDATPEQPNPNPSASVMDSVTPQPAPTTVDPSNQTSTQKTIAAGDKAPPSWGK
ncbi:hypothetical protein EVJ58_g3761 [Rhodofomes roseus]|uniref:Uncharacterized protein n=1 Tax=Rhodofomes roseus TaxID=34475 RepID=A0A4Y9YMA8_9APHY|nr:hypothetical protein EVJ58_g3761 [Rhodofomes roseus]